MTIGKRTPDSLARLLLMKLRQNDDSAKAVAARLGISQGHLSQLLAGEKSLAQARDKLVRDVAEYLGIPVVMAFLWSRKLCGKDFFYDQKSFGKRLQAGLRVVGQSQYAGEAGVSVDDLMELNEQVQLLLIHLFELAEGKSLIDGRVDCRRLLASDNGISPFEVRSNITS